MSPWIYICVLMYNIDILSIASAKVISLNTLSVKDTVVINKEQNITASTARVTTLSTNFTTLLTTETPSKRLDLDLLSAKDTAIQNKEQNQTTSTARITTQSSNISSTVTPSKRLDLAFIMDSTGSMSPYIENVKKHIGNLVDKIVASSNTDLRLALIEYRDHVPQETTFVTRQYDFTDSVKTMKTWLKAAHAKGGGDTPEAVADALHEARKLTWRRDSAKIGVLITDAPPHGLYPYMDRSFANGSPKGYDPMELARKLAKEEVTLYTVGCEPAIVPYKDFFMALAFLTGGQYIPLSDSRRLIDAIIGGAQEELSLQKFSTDVEQEIKKVQDAGGVVNEQSIAETVYQKLKEDGAKAKQLLRNNKPLDGASVGARAIAASHTMADVRNYYKIADSKIARKTIPAMESGPYMDPSLSSGVSYSGHASGSYVGETASLPKLELAPVPHLEGEAYAAVDSDVSLEQISRLVKKKTAKLSV